MSKTGVSPVIGVILMVAVTVALVALVTIVVFNIGGDVSNSPDATVQLEEQSGSVTATVLRNENVDEFRLENPTEGNVTIPGEPGSTGSLPAGSGRYKLIAVLPDGSEETTESIDSTPDQSNEGSSSGSSSQTISGTVTGSTVENATVQEIRQDGSVGNQTTTDSTGNYTLTVSNPETAQIRVSFVETRPDVEVSGSNNVSAAGVKTVRGSSTVDFNFSTREPDVVNETVNIEGVDEVRYLTNNDGEREIANPYQLQAINQSKSADYRLVSDINASQTESWNNDSGFDPIGSVTRSLDGVSVGGSFNGRFDGAGHTIDGLVINRSDANGVGLFEASNETIKNVGLTNASVRGDTGVGGLVALNRGSVNNSYATGSVTASSVVGGLVGLNGAYSTDSGNISNSYATADVVAVRPNIDGPIIRDFGNRVGGLVGGNVGTVSNSYATGNVSGFEKVGGLVGYNLNVDDIVLDIGTQGVDPEILSSYATGNVSGGGYTGGLVGDNGGLVSNSYATGNMSTTRGELGQIGGLVGFNDDKGNVSNSYATGSLTGSGVSGGVGGLVGGNSGSVNNSYATGKVSNFATSGNTIGDVGGLVGSNDGNVSNSYATGNVSGSNSDVGGLVGNNTDSQSVSDSYWNTVSTGQGSSDGGTDLTTSEMQGLSATENMSDFNFDTIWDSTDDSYPILRSLSREEQLIATGSG